MAAAATDLIDGKCARRTISTPFGDYADTFADAVFWAWFTRRPAEHRRVRAAAILTWLVPVAAVTALSVRRGRMVDAPRPRWVRPAATLQVVIAARALWGGHQSNRF